MRTAINPQTGERVQFDEQSNSWIPIPQQPSAQPQDVQPAPQGMQQPAQSDQGSFLPDFLTGADRETRATQDLPEMGKGGLLFGEDKAKVAAITPILLTTTNDQELANILTTQFPNIRMTEDEKGNLIANNTSTGAQVVINKPGVSQLDILQGLGIAAAYTPAARVATLGTQGAKMTAGAISRRVAQGSAAAGATEAIMQKGQEVAGGEFNKEDVAIATALGGGAELGLGLFKRNSELKSAISKKIESGSTDRSIAKYMANGAGKVKKDKAAKATIKQGIDEGVVSAIKGATQRDRNKMLGMLRSLKKGKENQLYGMKNRPSDIAGDSLLERVKYVKKINRDSGMQLDSVAKSLKGQEVDSTPAISAFLDKLSDMGVTVGGDLKPRFKGSDVEGLAAPEAAIKNIIKRLSSGKRGVMPDAYELHRMKKYIDEVVSYGKAGEGLTGKTERALKSLRKDLDGVLDNNFPVYDKVNTTYADTIGAIDSLQDVAGKKMNLSGKNADKATGVLLRRLMSNAQSRVTLMDAVETIESTAKKYKGNFNDDVYVQMLFADELDTVFKPVARTSLVGEMGKAVNKGANTAEGGLYRAGIDAVGKGADALRGINEDAAFKAIEELLIRGGK